MINFHLYPSPFKNETRILKETSSLTKLGLVRHVVILCIKLPGQPSLEHLDSARKVVRFNQPMASLLPEGILKKIVGYFEYYLQTLLYCVFRKGDIINCHSLMVLPIGWFSAVVTSKKLIYDPHELETERIGLTGGVQKISRLVERAMIYRASAVIVVSDSIGTWYREKYKLENVFVVKNTPWYTEAIKTETLRSKFNISSNELVFIYQGVFMKGRSLELYIRVFSKLSERYHLVFMGYGPCTNLVIEASQKYSNIHFQEAVKPEKIIEYTSSTDIGIHVPENICLSYFYSLPNKFFEYAMAGVPIIASNFPDMAHYIHAYKIGWITEVSEDDLLRVIKSLSTVDIEEKKNNLKHFAKNHNWENEEGMYKLIYQRI